MKDGIDIKYFSDALYISEYLSLSLHRFINLQCSDLYQKGAQGNYQMFKNQNAQVQPGESPVNHLLLLWLCRKYPRVRPSL